MYIKFPPLLNNKKILFVAKLLVTGFLCYLIFWNVDWLKIWTALIEINLLQTLSVFVLVLFSISLSTYKWKVILAIHQIYFDFNTLHRLSFIGLFFNNFIPGSIGGDAYRIYKTMDNPKSKSCAALAVVVERISGLGALIILGTLGGIVGFILEGDRVSRWVATVGSLSLCLLFLAAIILPSKKKIISLLGSNYIGSIVKNLIQHIHDYRENLTKTSLVILLSVAFHIHTLLFYYLMLDAVGASCQIYNLIVVIALSNLVGLLPLSLNGIGLIEGTFIFLMSHYGVVNEPALLVMLLFRAMLLALSLIGGILYLMQKRKSDNGKKVIEPMVVMGE